MAGSNNGKAWCVYALRCRGNYIYTGVTNDIDNRMKTHAEGRGSKYVRSHLPFELLKVLPCESKREALSFEYRLKRMKRDKKMQALGIQCEATTILPRYKPMGGEAISKLLNARIKHASTVS